MPAARASQNTSVASHACPLALLVLVGLQVLDDVRQILGHQRVARALDGAQDGAHVVLQQLHNLHLDAGDVGAWTVDEPRRCSTWLSSTVSGKALCPVTGAQVLSTYGEWKAEQAS